MNTHVMAPTPFRKNRKKHIQRRVQFILDCIPSDELLNYAEEMTKMKFEEVRKNGNPVLLDIILVALAKRSLGNTSVANEATRILLNYGFGMPEASDDDPDEREIIPMTLEEKIALVEKLQRPKELELEAD